MSRRTERVGKLLQQTIGQIVLRDLADPRIDPARTSITRVKVQEDLLAAKVYVSVIGSESQQALAVEALNRASGRIEGRCRQRVQLRRMPDLTFFVDEQFKGVLRTWEIINQAMEEIHEKEVRQDGPDAPDDAGGESADETSE